MARVLQERGVRIVSGGTDCHMFLVDLRAKNITGRDAEDALGRAHITVNKNAIPNDPQKPTVTSGIRIGSPAITTPRLRRGGGRATCQLDRGRARSTAKRIRAKAGAGANSGPVPEVPGVRRPRGSALRRGAQFRADLMMCVPDQGQPGQRQAPSSRLATPRR